MSDAHGDPELGIEMTSLAAMLSRRGQVHLHLLPPNPPAPLPRRSHHSNIPWSTLSAVGGASGESDGIGGSGEVEGRDVEDAFDEDGMVGLADDDRSVQERSLRCFPPPPSRRSPTNRWLSKRDLL